MDSDIFFEKEISPMLIAENQPPFDSDDYIYELKLDGIRCLAYLDESGTELRNKRNKSLNVIYPELSNIHLLVKNRCILDGELIILNEGKPDFYELQRRSFMSNPFKIEMASYKLPVCFTAFDMVYNENQPINHLPLLQRKELLSETVTENSFLAISRCIEKNGIIFFNLAKEQNLEGIVAKVKDSKYYFGKRSKDWIKIKALSDEDFVVCGYYLKAENLTSIILGSYQYSELIYISHVAMGVSRDDFKIIKATDRVSKELYKNFPEFEGAVWVKPVLVCKVEFMDKTQNGGLRQPIFKGLRNDKLPKECIV